MIHLLYACSKMQQVTDSTHCIFNTFYIKFDQVPLCVLIAWIMGIPMSLDFGLLETGCLGFSILLTAFALQVLTLTSSLC